MELASLCLLIALMTDGGQGSTDYTGFMTDPSVRWLPKLIGDGVPVLTHQGGRTWLVDNSHLQAKTAGIGHRVSKNLQDLDPVKTNLARWNSTIEGRDEGDGWVRVFLKGDAAVVEDKVEDKALKLEHTLRDAQFMVGQVAFSPDGVWLVTSSIDWGTRFYTLQGEDRPRFEYNFSAGGPGEVEEPDRQDWNMAISFSGDSRLLACGCLDQKVRLYDMKPPEGAPRNEFGVPKPRLVDTFDQAQGSVLTVAISRDNNWLVWGTHQKELIICPLAGGEIVVRKDTKDWVFKVAFSPDSRWLAAGGLDGRVRIYELQVGEEPRGAWTLRDCKESILTLAFSGNGKWLATGDDDNVLRIYARHEDGNATLTHTLGQPTTNLTNESALRFGENRIECLDFSPDGSWLAIGHKSRELRLHRILMDGSPRLRANFVDSRGPIKAVAFSANGRWLAAGSDDRRVRIYNMPPDPVALPFPTARPTTTTEEPLPTPMVFRTPNILPGFTPAPVQKDDYGFPIHNHDEYNVMDLEEAHVLTNNAFGILAVALVSISIVMCVVSRGSMHVAQDIARDGATCYRSMMLEA